MDLAYPVYGTFCNNISLTKPVLIVKSFSPITCFPSEESLASFFRSYKFVIMHPGDNLILEH